MSGAAPTGGAASGGTAGSAGTGGGASAGSASSSGSAAGGVGGSGGTGGNAGASMAGSSAGSGAKVFVEPLLHFDDPSACLPRPLPVNALFSQTSCDLYEVLDHACGCQGVARSPSNPPEDALIRANLQATGACGTSTTPACADYCICYVVQEIGYSGATCKMDPVAAAGVFTITSGYCYADDPASPALASCPANEKQKILFVSKSDDPMPRPGASVFLLCPGQ